MLAMIKQTAKAIFPTPILNVLKRYWGTVGRLQLGIVPKKRFDARNLRSLASLELSRIFSDPVITADWEQDHATINGLFGDVDYFEGVNPGDRRALYFLIMALGRVDGYRKI